MSNIRPRVLIVDDKENFRNGLARFLSLEGYEARRASSGRSAIRSYRRYGANVLILDMIMPEMDGIETLARISELDKNLPVIGITAFDSRDWAPKVKEHSLKVDLWIDKPLNKTRRQSLLLGIRKLTIQSYYNRIFPLLKSSLARKYDLSGSILEDLSQDMAVALSASGLAIPIKLNELLAEQLPLLELLGKVIDYLQYPDLRSFVEYFLNVETFPQLKECIDALNKNEIVTVSKRYDDHAKQIHELRGAMLSDDL